MHQTDRNYPKRMDRDVIALNKAIIGCKEVICNQRSDKMISDYVIVRKNLRGIAISVCSWIPHCVVSFASPLTEMHINSNLLNMPNLTFE